MKRYLKPIAVAAASAVLLGAAVAPATAAAPVETFTATDLPVKVRIGAPYQEVTFTTITKTPVDEVYISLVDKLDDEIAFGSSQAPERSRPRVHKVPVEIFDDVNGWGQMTWYLAGYRGYTDDVVDVLSTVTADVRAHSMLGVGVSRNGSTATIKGSLRAYNTTVDRYAAWSSRPVVVERLNGSTWQRVTTVTTSRTGDLNVQVSVPKGTQLRLVTADTPGIWGASSRTVTS